jgi:quinol monooxygenase YgiN
MSDSSLRVIARGRAKEGALNAIQKVIQPLVEAMQDHEYCLRYELWSSDRHPDDFVIYQEWSDERALEAHLSSEMVQEVGFELGHLVMGPPIVWHYRKVL